MLLGACSAILRDPVPAKDLPAHQCPWPEDLRIWGDQREPQQYPSIDQSDPTILQREFSGIMHTEHNYLAISGGGADGAYGAGVLVGWSKQGTRPEFTMVTGVSTGALTAPFAFLGAAYDDELKMLYTTPGQLENLFPAQHLLHHPRRLCDGQYSPAATCSGNTLPMT